MVDPFVIGETASDNRLVSFDDNIGGSTLPFMGIGRLPADNTADVTAMVVKNREVRSESAGG